MVSNHHHHYLFWILPRYAAVRRIPIWSSSTHPWTPPIEQAHLTLWVIYSRMHNFLKFILLFFGNLRTIWRVFSRKLWMCVGRHGVSLDKKDLLVELDEKVAALVKEKQRLLKLWKGRKCNKGCRCEKSRGWKLCGHGRKAEIEGFCVDKEARLQPGKGWC